MRMRCSQATSKFISLFIRRCEKPISFGTRDLLVILVNEIGLCLHAEKEVAGVGDVRA